MNTKEEDEIQLDYIKQWNENHPIDWVCIGLFILLYILVISGFLWGILI